MNGVGPPPGATLHEWIEQQFSIIPTLGAIPVEGVRIAYRGWGLEKSEAPGILLVHGIRAHAGWWDHIAPSLAADGYRVAALDLSGMGDSEHREHYSRDQLGREISAVARGLGFDCPTVIAHSFGGLLAMREAAANPAGFARLIVVDAGLLSKAESRRPISESRARHYVDQASALARFRLVPLVREPVPLLVDHIARLSMKPSEQGWRWKFDPSLPTSLNQEAAETKDLCVTRVKADFIYAADSEIVTAETLSLVPSQLPTAGHPIAIPACSHHIMLEQPLALIGTIRALLSSAGRIRNSCPQST